MRAKRTLLVAGRVVQLARGTADGLEVDNIGFGAVVEIVEVVEVEVVVITWFMLVVLVLLLSWVLRVRAGLGRCRRYVVGSLPFLQKGRRRKERRTKRLIIYWRDLSGVLTFLFYVGGSD